MSGGRSGESGPGGEVGVREAGKGEERWAHACSRGDGAARWEPICQRSMGPGGTGPHKPGEGV